MHSQPKRSVEEMRDRLLPHLSIGEHNILHLIVALKKDQLRLASLRGNSPHFTNLVKRKSGFYIEEALIFTLIKV